MTATMTWTRLTRRLGSDHNPLRRRSDLIEAWLVPAVIAVFLALGPLAGWGAATWVHHDITAARHAQRSWHSVHAVLLSATAGPLMSDNGANSWTVWAPARWTVGGQPHVGQVPAAAGSREGSSTPVWVDRTGNVRVPPLTAGQARGRVSLAVSAALAVLAVLLAGLALTYRRVLVRRRLASWEADWRSVSPLWSLGD
jgi:hypothetical protein